MYLDTVEPPTPDTFEKQDTHFNTDAFIVVSILNEPPKYGTLLSGHDLIFCTELQ